MLGEFFITAHKIMRSLSLLFRNTGDKILDLGCGHKPYYHSSIKGSIVCFDIKKTKITDVVGDADKLGTYFKPNTFDKIVSINSFYYFKNPFNVATDISKILKKDGLFILVVPFFYPIHDVPEDKYRFTEYGLRTILQNNLKIEKIETIGGIFNLPAVILHSIIKGTPLFFPKNLRSLIKIFMLVLYPLYIIFQLFSLLDFFDKTRRFPTYYFVVARKRQ